MDVPIRDRRIQGCYHVISPLINPVDERGHFTVDDVTDVPSKLKLVMSIDGGGGRGQLLQIVHLLFSFLPEFFEIHTIRIIVEIVKNLKWF